MNKKHIWAAVALCVAVIATFVSNGAALQWRALSGVIMLAGCVAAFFFLQQEESVLPGHIRLTALRSARWPQYHFWAGPEKLFEQYFMDQRRWGGVQAQQERIELVANKHSNGNIYAVERPGRHSQVISLLAELGLDESGKHDEGYFVTNHGRVVDRSEAWIVARDAGQIIRPNENGSDVLYSENLWTTPVAYYAPEIESFLFGPGDGSAGMSRAELLSTLPSLDELTVEAQTAEHQETGFDKLLDSYEKVSPLKARIHSVLTATGREYLASLKEAEAPAPEVEVIPEGGYGVHLVDGKLVLPEGILTIKDAVELAYLANEAYHQTWVEHHQMRVDLGYDTWVPAKHTPMPRQEFLEMYGGQLTTIDAAIDFIRKTREKTELQRIVTHEWRWNHRQSVLRDRSEELRVLATFIDGEPKPNTKKIQQFAQMLINEAIEEKVVLTIEYESHPSSISDEEVRIMVPKVTPRWDPEAARRRHEQVVMAVTEAPPVSE